MEPVRELGCICVPGADIVEKFNRKHDFDLIVRAHQVFAMFHDFLFLLSGPFFVTTTHAFFFSSVTAGCGGWL